MWVEFSTFSLIINSHKQPLNVWNQQKTLNCKAFQITEYVSYETWSQTENRRKYGTNENMNEQNNLLLPTHDSVITITVSQSTIAGVLKPIKKCKTNVRNIGKRVMHIEDVLSQQEILRLWTWINHTVNCHCWVPLHVGTSDLTWKWRLILLLPCWICLWLVLPRHTIHWAIWCGPKTTTLGAWTGSSHRPVTNEFWFVFFLVGTQSNPNLTQVYKFEQSAYWYADEEIESWQALTRGQIKVPPWPAM